MTINWSLGLKTGPFIPCERRLGIMEIWEIQGRVFRGPFLKQGLWQASSLFLVDTPGFILTLGYILLNLALIEGQYGCGSQVCGGPSQGPECLGTRCTPNILLLGPWQYQCSLLGGYLVSTRYSTHPVPPSRYHAHDPHCHQTTGHGLLGTCTYDRSEADQGDPRGG